jgi:hypothetical protein
MRGSSPRWRGEGVRYDGAIGHAQGIPPPPIISEQERGTVKRLEVYGGWNVHEKKKSKVERDKEQKKITTLAPLLSRLEFAQGRLGGSGTFVLFFFLAGLVG